MHKGVFASLEGGNWNPPEDWMRIRCVDMHTGGEPLRVVVSGLPAIEGSSVLEKRRYFREHLDYIRTALMWEPRGHADMYGAVITASSDADVDTFFLHNEGYSTMCGHAIIALTTLAVECGSKSRDNAAEQEIQITFNVPAGRIIAKAKSDGGKARDVRFRNVPSYLHSSDNEVVVPEIGRVRFDIAYGGAFYAIVDAVDLGLELTTSNHQRLIDCGRRIKQSAMQSIPIKHPFEEDLSFLYGTIFTGAALDPQNHSRNVCIFADGELDRSATGSGVSARAAFLHAKGGFPLHTKISIESILGSTMTVEAVEATQLGPHAAIVPEVGGIAFITGRHEFLLNPTDPFARGFLVR